MIETRWWAVAYANASGTLGTLDIQIQDAQPFPVTASFWRDMQEFVRSTKNGTLLALTPASERFGSMLGRSP